MLCDETWAIPSLVFFAEVGGYGRSVDLQSWTLIKDCGTRGIDRYDSTSWQHVIHYVHFQGCPPTHVEGGIILNAPSYFHISVPDDSSQGRCLIRPLMKDKYNENRCRNNDAPTQVHLPIDSLRTVNAGRGNYRKVSVFSIGLESGEFKYSHLLNIRVPHNS